MGVAYTSLTMHGVRVDDGEDENKAGRRLECREEQLWETFFCTH